MPDNDQIVSNFCEAWGNGDVDAIVGAFADDAIYHNIPMAPIEGKQAIGMVISGFLASNKIVFETHKQVTNGDIVMNERTDYITGGDRDIEMPVMGVFELTDGKITAWRDYFDLKTFTGE